jgi:hypothetical protein
MISTPKTIERRKIPKIGIIGKPSPLHEVSKLRKFIFDQIEKNLFISISNIHSLEHTIREYINNNEDLKKLLCCLNRNISLLDVIKDIRGDFLLAGVNAFTLSYYGEDKAQLVDSEYNAKAYRYYDNYGKNITRWSFSQATQQFSRS